LAHYVGTIPSKSKYPSMHVDPISPPEIIFGGGAGYCPRVHYIYIIFRLLP